LSFLLQFINLPFSNTRLTALKISGMYRVAPQATIKGGLNIEELSVANQHNCGFINVSFKRGTAG
jgi:hypothetical protein